MIGAQALHLDRSPFLSGEATVAATALGPLDREDRLPQATPGHRFIGGFGLAITTTERGLRLCVALGIILAALVTGEVAAGLAGAQARPLVWLAFAAHPLTARSDLLYPGLLAPFPMALILGGALYLRGGSTVWALAAVIGAAAAATLDTTVQVIALTLVVALPLVTRAPRPLTTRLWLAQLVALAAAWHGAGRPWLSGTPVTGEPGLTTLFGADVSTALDAAQTLAAAAILGPLLFRLCRDPRAAALRPIALAAAAAAITLGALHLLAPGYSTGAGITAALPPLILAFAICAAAAPALRRCCGAVLSVVILLSMADAAPTWRLEKRGPLESVLDHTRARSTTGGRLVLWGEDRHALLYYLRRGHDPGVPVVLVDEEVEMHDLAPLLRDRLRVAPGEEARAPTILIHPPCEPPGLELSERPATEHQVASLRLKAR